MNLRCQLIRLLLSICYRAAHSCSAKYAATASDNPAILLSRASVEYFHVLINSRGRPQTINYIATFIGAGVTAGS